MGFTNWDEADPETVEEGSCLAEEELEALGLLLEERGDSRRLDRPESFREAGSVTEEGQTGRAGLEADEEPLLPEVDSCGSFRYSRPTSSSCEGATIFNMVLVGKKNIAVFIYSA